MLDKAGHIKVSKLCNWI